MLTDDEYADLGNLIGSYSQTVGNLRRLHRLAAIERSNAGVQPCEVTDHAVVRYLARVEGMDIDAVRGKIRTLLAESVPTKEEEHHWHPSGVILIVAEKGRIVTLLGQDQLETWIGRKLPDGSRIYRSGAGTERSGMTAGERELARILENDNG